MTVSLNHLDKKLVSQTFGNAAPQYAQAAHLQHATAQQLLTRLDMLKIEPQVVGDIGAGAGWLTRELAAKYQQAQVYAVDIALPMLKQAKQQIPWHLRFLNRVRQTFICSDAAQLPLADNSVDLLVSNLMLQWCSDFQQVFREFSRVLKPEGALIFATLGPDTLKELRASWAAVDAASHVNQFYDMHDIGDALLQAHFKDPVMDVDWEIFYYAQTLDLMQELKNIGAHNITAGRPRSLMGKQKFQKMVAHYEQYRQPRGLPATYEVVFGHAAGKRIAEPTPAVEGESNVVAIPISNIGGRRKV